MRESCSLESLDTVTLEPYVIHFTAAPDTQWTANIGLQLSPSQSRKGMPHLYALVEQAGLPIMRLDLYRQGACSDFRDAVAIWKQWLIIAYCDYLYLVSLSNSTVHAYALQGYFGSLEGLTDHLLVADARRLLCFDEEAHLLWSVDLGVDGVIFAIEGDVVVGRAEIDPPAGWVPFRVALQSGERLTDRAEDGPHRGRLGEEKSTG